MGVAALVTVPLIFVEDQLKPMTTLWLNFGIWCVFTISFLSTLFVCKDKQERLDFIKASTLDLLIILGSFPILPSTLQSLRILRVGRATRLIQLLRLGRVFALGWLLRWAQKRFRLNPVLFSGTVTIIAIFVGANALHIFEPVLAPSLSTALWWAVTTVSTVGYGDISPSTPEGRLVGGCLMIVGVAAMAGFSGALASYLVRHPEGDEPQQTEKLDKVLTELQEIRSQLERIERLRDETRKVAEASHDETSFPKDS